MKECNDLDAIDRKQTAGELIAHNLFLIDGLPFNKNFNRSQSKHNEKVV